MNRLRTLATPILAVGGVAVGSYLTWAHYNTGALVCGIGDCVEVQTSAYAKLGGVPVAILGLLMYLALLAGSLVRLARQAWSAWISPALFVVSLSGMLFSGWLTYVEIWVIEAICQWCVVSALITLAICIVETERVWRGEPMEPE